MHLSQLQWSPEAELVSAVVRKCLFRLQKCVVVKWLFNGKGVGGHEMVHLTKLKFHVSGINA